MVKRNSTRRRARKPKVAKIPEVLGRQLSPAQWGVFQQKMLQRSSLISRAEQQAQALALSDLDFSERVSPKASDILVALGKRGMDATLTLSTLKDFAFYRSDKKLIGLANAIIGYCADEIEAVASELRSLHTCIEQEVSREEVPHD
jgi:hypothetical protein